MTIKSSVHWVLISRDIDNAATTLGFDGPQVVRASSSIDCCGLIVTLAIWTLSSTLTIAIVDNIQSKNGMSLPEDVVLAFT